MKLVHKYAGIFGTYCNPPSECISVTDNWENVTCKECLENKGKVIHKIDATRYEWRNRVPA